MKHLITNIFNKKIYRFIFVGGINTVIGYGTFAIFLYFGMHYYFAYILSYIVGVSNSYIWNKLFTFKSKNKSYKEFIRFTSVYLISFLIGSAFLYIIVDIFDFNAYIGGAINLVLTTTISWTGHNKYSFKNIDNN